MNNEQNKSLHNIKYNMSYTACHLVSSETIKVAQLFLEERDWKQVSKIAFERNLLQYRTENALKRTLSEIISRLKILPLEAIDILVNGTPFEQNQILWFALCLRYQFIYDFAIEVI